MIMKLGEVYKVFNYKKKSNFFTTFLDKEKKGGRKADKRKLVNVVSVETANKFAYVIL